MKYVFTKSLALITMLGLTACNNGGGGSNNNNNQTATIPGPQGQVTAMNDASTYCQFNQGTFICTGRNYSGVQCNTTTYTYTDIPSMCQQIYREQNQGHMNGQCNVSTVLTRLVQENCQGVAQQVNVIPGPQGQVTAMNDASTYCQFNQGSFICTGRNYSGVQCNTTTYTYIDTPSMCQQLYLVQNQGFATNGQCNVSTVLTRLIQENCQGVAQQGNANPWQNGNQNQQIDANFKTIQCEFEAYRVNQRRFFNSNTGTGKVTAMMTFDSRMRQDIDLRSKFLGIDVGNFGKTKMTFTPAGVRGTSDTITLSNDGLNKDMTLSQSGFAGESVSLVATSEDGSTKLSVSCKGQSQFKKNVTTAQFTKYVCRGQSKLFAGGGKEDIEVALPYNSSLMNNEIMLAEGLTAQVTGDATGTDNARITFTAQGVGSDMSVVSSAYLKTSTSLAASDGYNSVNVTCTPQ